ncbi:MAG: hypothetical protein S4CHLAM102_09640 [Chlamydiia bacterium]|nr:hypothetical protein [Chlamydiia bacterium]
MDDFHTFLEGFVEENNPTHLLAQLKLRFSPQKIEEAELPAAACPRFYQPLPIEKQKLKAPFSSLYTLTQICLDSILTHIYEKAPDPIGGKCVIFTWLHPNGLGDLSCQTETLSILKPRFPNIEFLPLTLCNKDREIPPLKDHILIQEEEIHKSNHDYLAKRLAPHLDGADLILQIPTAFPLFASVTNNYPNTLTIGEYGFIDTKFFHPESANRSMGLHFLEMGIFIPPVASSTSLLDLLPKKIGPMIREENHLYFPYMFSPKKYRVFLLSLFTSLDDDRDIDCLIVNLDRLLPVLEDHLDEFWASGIGRIELYTRVGKSVIEGNKGKVWRIFELDKLPADTFRALRSKCEGPIACTGNMSFSESIAQEELFFYDALCHTCPFIQNYIDCAKGAFPDNRELHEYLEYFLEPDPPVETLAQYFVSPTLKESFKALSQLIKQNYNFSERIPLITKRALLHVQNPELAEQEKKLVQAYLREEIELLGLFEKLEEAFGKI